MKDDQRVALTKRLLKEGLFRLLQTKDISKIGVTELCRESGINRATFYRHFEQPRDILNEVRHDLFCDIKRILNKRRTAEKNRGRLHLYLRERGAYKHSVSLPHGRRVCGVHKRDVRAL